jgi:hypothetical protein
MKLSQKLFLFISILWMFKLQAQKCEHKGPLLWIKDGQLQQKAVYQTKDELAAVFYNPNQLDSLRLDFRIGQQEISAKLPLTDLTDFPKPSVLEAWQGKYSRLLLVPSNYPKTSEFHQAFAQALVANGQKQTDVEYRGAEAPLAGCIRIDLSKGFGQYDLREELDQLKQFNEQKVALLQKIETLEQQKTEKLEMIAFGESKLAEAEASRTQLRTQHQNLSEEEQQVLNKLIEQSDQVGKALNEAILKNDKAMARKVADLTGSYQKYLKEVKAMPIYSEIQSSFDNYYRQSTIYFTHDRNLSKLQQEVDAIDAKIKLEQEALKKLEAEIQAYLEQEK